PNPATDRLVVTYGGWQERPVQVGIYSPLGQEVFRQQVDYWTPDGLTIDTKKLPAGTYLLRLDSDGEVPLTEQIVILH
ncbi:MAG: T9SS type A sorting domain-containing protein, partial [Bacteroidota bacterium]